MACIYCGRDGICTLYDEDVNTTWETDSVGWNEDGVCVVEDDPDPGFTCSNFEDIER